MPGTAAIVAAELRLRAALLAGSATADLHAELAALRAEHARALAEQAEAATEARSEEQRAHRVRVAEAAAGHAAAAAHREAAAHHDQLCGKIAGLDDARRAIGARRAAGDQRSTDGAELALIAADHEALAGIQGEHEAALAVARAAAEEAVRALEAARFALGREEDLAEDRALTEHLDRLDAQLRDTVVRANGVARRLGRSRPAWTPSRQTMDLLHPLHHGRAWL